MEAPEYNETRMKADLDHLDTFQLRGDESGWSRDGPDGVKQLDYYSGSFAIASAMLVYSNIAQDFDPERCAGYRKRMLKFALDQVYYFDDAGKSHARSSGPFVMLTFPRITERPLHSLWSIDDLSLRGRCDILLPSARL